MLIVGNRSVNSVSIIFYSYESHTKWPAVQFYDKHCYTCSFNLLNILYNSCFRMKEDWCSKLIPLVHIKKMKWVVLKKIFTFIFWYIV